MEVPDNVVLFECNKLKKRRMKSIATIKEENCNGCARNSCIGCCIKHILSDIDDSIKKLDEKISNLSEEKDNNG